MVLRSLQTSLGLIMKRGIAVLVGLSMIATAATQTPAFAQNDDDDNDRASAWLLAGLAGITIAGGIALLIKTDDKEPVSP